MHTPGPWKATRSIPQEGFDCWWITANHLNNFEKELATVGGGTAASEGNAHLIAAAPDLLDVLESFMRLSGPPTQDDIERARIAIAKAKGPMKE